MGVSYERGTPAQKKYEPQHVGLPRRSFISYIYSAPPLKLKQSGWIGNYALGASYIALPWWCGQCFFNVESFNPTVQPAAQTPKPSHS